MIQYLKTLLLAALTVFAPIKAVLISAMVLTMADMVLGIIAARKLKKRVTSKGLGRTVVKIAVYEAAVICGFLVEKYLIAESLPLVKILGGLIGVTELISVLENADIISENRLFRSVIDRLQSQSNKVVEDNIKEDDKQ